MEIQTEIEIASKPKHRIGFTEEDRKILANLKKDSKFYIRSVIENINIDLCPGPDEKTDNFSYWMANFFEIIDKTESVKRRYRRLETQRKRANRTNALS